MTVAVCSNVSNVVPCVAKQDLWAHSFAGKISILQKDSYTIELSYMEPIIFKFYLLNVLHLFNYASLCTDTVEYEDICIIYVHTYIVKSQSSSLVFVSWPWNLGHVDIQDAVPRCA